MEFILDLTFAKLSKILKPTSIISAEVCSFTSLEEGVVSEVSPSSLFFFRYIRKPTPEITKAMAATMTPASKPNKGLSDAASGLVPTVARVLVIVELALALAVLKVPVAAIGAFWVLMVL